jgi:hypothetical protein
MNAAAVARGPDEDRVYTDFFSGVSLGARRLRIINVKGGRQPASNEDGATTTERYGPRSRARSTTPGNARFEFTIDYCPAAQGSADRASLGGPMRILVTGHNGYIGSMLVPTLEPLRHGVVGLDSDLFAPCTFGPNAHEVEWLRTDVHDHDYGGVFEAR